VIGIAMATMLEAEPFITGLGLKEVDRSPFHVFTSGHTVLVVTGMGKINAALGVAHLATRHGVSTVCNIGAAGALSPDAGIGEIFQVREVVEPDRLHVATGEIMRSTPSIVDGIPEAVLATMDRPIRETSERRAMSRLAGLVDMEGAGICQASRRYGLPCHLVKFVSDTSPGCDIAWNIGLLRDTVFAFCRDTFLWKLGWSGPTRPGA